MAVEAPGGYQNTTFLLPTHPIPFASALGFSATELKFHSAGFGGGAGQSKPHFRLPLSLRSGECHSSIAHHHKPNLAVCWKCLQGSCAKPTTPFPNRTWFCSCNHHPFPGRIRLPNRQPVPLFPSPVPTSDPKVPPRCSGLPRPTRATFQGRGSGATHRHSCPG